MVWFRRSKCECKYVPAEEIVKEAVVNEGIKETWEEGITRRMKESKEKAKKEHEANLYADQDDEVMSRTWLPQVTIHPTQLGTLIEYEGTEFNAVYTTEITVAPGQPPRIDYCYGGYCYAMPAQHSHITITSVAGNKKTISISRHKADALFAEIMRQWKLYR